MTDKAAAIDRIIEMLGKVRQRPTMYLGTVNQLTVHAMVLGLDVACDAFGCGRPGLELRAQVVRQRGWEWGATGGVEDMQRRGLSEEQIADELIAIEIDILQHRRDREVT